jgi:hypothetical protein
VSVRLGKNVKHGPWLSVAFAKCNLSQCLFGQYKCSVSYHNHVLWNCIKCLNVVVFFLLSVKVLTVNWCIYYNNTCII